MTETSNTRHVISLGAGVQSSAMALMAARGELTPMPDCAVFADTQAEPKSVYLWLDRLEKELPFPIVRVTKGDLETASLKVRTSARGNKYTKHAVPAFIVDVEGKRGLLMRQCTLDFKISEINRFLRRHRKRHAGAHISQWIGISRDEAHRMKPSRLGYVTNIWPLVEKGMTRQHCLQWLKGNGFPNVPRSSCVFCPYHSDSEWRRLKANEPEAFRRAVTYDAALRDTLKGVIRGTPFIHHSRIPLADVDFEKQSREQPDLFGNKCEGICGV